MPTNLVRVDRAVYLRLKSLSDDHGRSMSSLIEKALDAFTAPESRTPIQSGSLNQLRPNRPQTSARPHPHLSEPNELTYEPEN